MGLIAEYGYWTRPAQPPVYATADGSLAGDTNATGTDGDGEGQQQQDGDEEAAESDEDESLEEEAPKECLPIGCTGNLAVNESGGGGHFQETWPYHCDEADDGTVGYKCCCAAAKRKESGKAHHHTPVVLRGPARARRAPWAAISRA